MLESIQTEPKVVSLSFRPDVKLVSCVRRFVSEFCASVLKDLDVASRVALTIHELLENTLKYSKDGQADVNLTLGDDQGHRVVKIQSTSRATAEQVIEVSRRIDSLRNIANPLATYVQMMEESTENENQSGLGLVRIRVEGEMDLTYSVTGDLITITAETPVDRPAKPSLLSLQQ